MIEGAQRMVRINNNSQEEELEVKINPAMKRHLVRNRETLQNAPRDEGKLREELLKLKEREYEQEATQIENTQRLVTEIEMLKVAYFKYLKKAER
jgi:aspartyl/asparaginyl beta-hydroxylase (cupin superfamily)